MIAAAVLALLALAGCSTPKHTDLLVFGTNTSFGVSIKGDATSTAGIDVGFRRQELVLMPLYVNGTESQAIPTPPTSNLADGKYQAIDSDARKDTYSVLASFGARGNGSSSSGAQVSIAQYFATGLAARTLALAGGALVSTSDIAAAQPISAGAISAEKAADIRKWISERDAKVGQIADKVFPGGTLDTAKRDAAFKDVPNPPPVAVLATITTRDQLVAELGKSRYDPHIDQILKNVL